MSRISNRRPAWPMVVATTIVLTALLVPVTPLAQQPYLHFNPVIEKLAQGKAVFGLRVADFSLEHAHAVARSGVDYIRLDMEHSPMNVSTVLLFLHGMVDKAAILKKGNAQFPVAPFVRISPYGRDIAQSDWVVKQMLDSGVMGIVFPTVETKAEAEAAVRSMRYAQLKGSPHFQPYGLRGVGAIDAGWLWGVPGDVYRQHADLWPLNPEGDLLCIIMIETATGVRNADAIMSTPGVSAVFVGCCGDLPASLGVPDVNDPENQEALQTIVRACVRNNVPCLYPGTGTRELVESRLKAGWRGMELAGSVAGSIAPLLAAGRAFVK